jgi:predicted RNA-binding Zn-ribbon protein involved in translation (DUF1610 family)
METKKYLDARKTQTVKAGRTFDGAYGFSFSVGLGLLLFIAGLVVSLALGLGPGVGLAFGIPLLMAGLVVPIFMMRGIFKTNEIAEACPYCGEPIKTTDATLKLNCPKCRKLITVRDGTFFRVD